MTERVRETAEGQGQRYDRRSGVRYDRRSGSER